MIFKKFLESKQARTIPFMNQIANFTKTPEFQIYTQVSRKRRIMSLATRHVEVMNVVDGHADDLTGPYWFEPVSGRSSGGNSVKLADEFARKIRFEQLRKETIIDILITGEGFNYVNIPSKEQVRTALKELLLTKKDAFGVLENKQLFDEDVQKPFMVTHVASTSMSIKYDDSKILGYVQEVGGRKKEFGTKEIVRLFFTSLDGKVGGWSPFYAMPLQLELLWLMWLNQWDLQAKGNHPDKIFVFKDMHPDSPEYRAAQATLKTFNQPGGSKHGHLMMTGDTEVLDIEKVDHLQFQDVGQYISTLIANAFLYPIHRVGIKTKEASASKDSNGSSDRAYWLSVEKKQKLLCEIWNSQLWEPYFGVRMVPDRRYLHDQVVEQTAFEAKMRNIEHVNNQLARIGKQLKQEALIKYINGFFIEIDPNDIEDIHMVEGGQPPILSSPNSSYTSSRQSPNDHAAEKRQEELQREVNQGKPTGMG